MTGLHWKQWICICWKPIGKSGFDIAYHRGYGLNIAVDLALHMALGLVSLVVVDVASCSVVGLTSLSVGRSMLYNAHSRIL